MPHRSAGVIAALVVLGFATDLSSLRSQKKLVFPAIAAKAEGSLSSSDYKLGTPWATNPSKDTATHAFRYVLVSDLPGGTKGMITQLSFRRDGSVGAGERTQAFQVEMSLAMSHAKVRAGKLSTRFADAIGSDNLEVLKKQRLIFGTRPFDGTFPEAFRFVIPLDKPFAYDASKGSLCYDLKHYTNTLYNHHHGHGFTVSLDAIESSQKVASLRNASRCFSPNPWKPAIQYSQHLGIHKHNGKNMLRFWAERKYAHHHSQGLLVLSTGLASRGRSFDCGTFWIDERQAFLYTVSISDDQGNATWPPHAGHHGGALFMVPFKPEFMGIKIYGQEVNRDIHNLKVSATNWMVSQVPTWLGSDKRFGMRGLYAAGKGSHAASTGTLGPNGAGPVVEYGLR